MIKSFEDLLCLAACIWPFALSAVLAAVLWWGWRCLAIRGFRSSIEMEGASCLIAQDGSVLIRPHTLRNLVYLAIVGGGLAGITMIFIVIANGRVSIEEVGLRGLLMTIGYLPMLVGACFLLLRSIGQPRMRIRRQAGEIEWSRWLRRQRHPFQVISQVVLILPKRPRWLQPVINALFETEVMIKIQLMDGGRLLAGHVSGRYSRRRASAAAKAIAKAIGVPIQREG